MSGQEVSRRAFIGEALGLCAAGPAFLHRGATAGTAHQAPSSPRSGRPNPFMEDGKPVVALIRGTDFPAMFERGMEILGGFSGFGSEGSVIVKPNFVFDQRTRYPATTDEQSVLEVVRRLQDEGFGDITVADRRARKVNGRAGGKFEWSGMNDLAESEGFRTDSLLDDGVAEAVQVGDRRWTEMPSIGVLKTIYDADLIINMPTLKRHSQTNLTCALKNLMGVLDVPTTQLMHLWGDENRERYESMSPEEVTRRLCLTIAEVASAVNPEMTIVDARTVLTRHHGDVRTGEPRDANCLIMSGDSLAVDVQAVNLLRSVIRDYDPGPTVHTLEYAARLGVGIADPDGIVLKEAEV